MAENTEPVAELSVEPNAAEWEEWASEARQWQHYWQADMRLPHLAAKWEKRARYCEQQAHKLREREVKP